MLVKIPTLNSSGAANNTDEPGAVTTLIGTYQHNTFAGLGGAQGTTHEYVAMWLLDNGKVRYAKRGMASDGVTIRTTLFDSTQDIDDNQWHRLALVGDGVNNRCYLDGVLLHTLVNPAATFVENPQKPVIVNGALFRYWEGQAADIRIFERALSTTEIATLGSTPDTSVYYEPLQGAYEPQYPLVGVQKQNDGTVGFKFEKSDGSAITETEIPSSYSLKCKICTC